MHNQTKAFARRFTSCESLFMDSYKLMINKRVFINSKLVSTRWEHIYALQNPTPTPLPAYLVPLQYPNKL